MEAKGRTATRLPRVSGLVAALASIGLLAAACGGSDELSPEAQAIAAGDCVEDSGDEVTIYSGRTQELIEPILDAFACDTGIGVRVRWGDSTDLAVLINEEGDATEADVFLSRSPGPVGFLEINDHLGQVDPATLDLVDDQNRADSGAWVGFSARKRVVVRNIDQVDDDELPSSIFDLTDDRYQDRVALPATNGSFEDWFTVFRDREGSDVATEWLDAMVDNGARYYPNNRAIVDAVGRGEIDFGLVNHYYNYQEVAALGDEHRAENHDVDPNDIGSLLIVTAATVLDVSDNQEAANELLRYLLSEPAQRYFTEETFEYPLAAGVPAADILPPIDGAGAGSVDFDSLGGGFEETERIIRESGILNQ